MPCCVRIVFVLIRPLVLEGSVEQKLEVPFFYCSGPGTMFTVS